MWTFVDGLQRQRDVAVVMQRLFQRRPPRDELFKVATGGKGIAAGAAQHDATNAAVNANFGHLFGQLVPHAKVDGIQLARVVQGQCGDLAVAEKINGAHKVARMTIQ